MRLFKGMLMICCALPCWVCAAEGNDEAGQVEVDYASSTASEQEQAKARNYEFSQFIPLKTNADAASEEELITDRTKLLEVGSAKVRLSTGADVHGQEKDLTMTEYSVTARVPVYHNDKGDFLLFSTGFEGTHFSGGMQLNNTDPGIYGGSTDLGAALPEDLYSVNFGLNTR